MLSSEQIDERVITLQKCNNVINDEILFRYMQVVGPKNLEQRLFEEREWEKELDKQPFTAE